MKKLLTIVILYFIIMTQINANPFLKKYKTVHGTHPFKEIENKHFMPAFEEGIKQNLAEVEKIANNKDKPTFENTILALENSGEILDKVSSVFYVLLGAESDDEMLLIAQEIQPKLTEMNNKIKLNEKLFQRIKTIYDNNVLSSNFENAEIKDQKLTTEQSRLVDNYYKSFENSGANLSKEDKKKYEELSNKLAKLTLDFGQNALKYSNKYELLITDEDKLDGLTELDKASALKKAKDKNKDGWLFDLSAPSYVGFMKNSNNRELREQFYKIYNARNYNINEFDNKEIVKEIVESRKELANLLGYEDFASYKLNNKMAKNKEGVYNLLDNLLNAYSEAAKQDVLLVQTFAKELENDPNLIIQPWDWSYYSEKLKDAKYSVSDEIVRPYFELENVKKGVFGLATDLYGIKLQKNENIDTYHPDVEAFDVIDENGDYLAVLYTDFHPRKGKRQGAWMTEFKGQHKENNGDNSRPHVAIVMNFTSPTDDKPALLTYDEVNTFLHEFGHALHGIMAQATYESLSGTNVKHDFVELPSQIMENWLTEKEFLDKFATHYQTGEKISDELVQKLIDAANFNAAYACYRQLSFGYLDMAWHSIQNLEELNDIEFFEKQAIQKTNILPSVDGTCLSTSFSHIFSGGYAAGYYGYKWAEVLDADAFAKFKEDGIYNKETANSFRRNILEKGDTEEPMELYIRFRGKTPTVDALLKRTGINKK